MQKERIDSLKKQDTYYAKRIAAELSYAAMLSSTSGSAYDDEINSTLDYLENVSEIDASVVSEAENMLVSVAREAKRKRVFCAAHAHIDMNWMWGFHETAAITIDTFRTMLDLMNEYPDFVFSQSQASVYKIVEEYNPDMLCEIKRRVKEGRWELTANTWVETDKNMPNAESLARHMLYTRRYMSKLLDVDPSGFKLDFEPDTFGHNQNVPELLVRGGVKYYYHCRGFDSGPNYYRWEAPSGASVLVFREVQWYNSGVDSDIILRDIDEMLKAGLESTLRVYGVGDHGGGPTRRDIESIISLNAWPVFPQVVFGTYHQFFAELEKNISKLPVVQQELNPCFTGCYSSQSRIKMGARMGEARLLDSETLSAQAALFGELEYPAKSFETAWRKHLFNHFHDILPGSGVTYTREHALGLFQETLAAANTNAMNAMLSIASKIDTSGFDVELPVVSVSEGGGVGYDVNGFSFPHAERGRGKLRIFHLFNTTAYNRHEAVDITVWDWEGDTARLKLTDSKGGILEHQLMNKGEYWGHTYISVLVNVPLKGFGYSTIVLNEGDTSISAAESSNEFVMENDKVKAIFDPQTMRLTSFIDMQSGKPLIGSNTPSAIFRYIEEKSKGMTAWVVGEYESVTELNTAEHVKVTEVKTGKNLLRQIISYEIAYKNSKLKITASLDAGADEIVYAVECHWLECGKPDAGIIPQLNFYAPFGYKAEKYRYDIPMGTIDRGPVDEDMPGNSFIIGLNEDKDCKSLMLSTDTKYGYRGSDNSIAVSLIRSSYDPDLYPELGVHKFKIALGIPGSVCPSELIKQSQMLYKPISYISGKKHSGKMPLDGQFIELDGGAVVSSVKIAEDNTNAMIIRLYEAVGKADKAVLRFYKNPVSVKYVDINEVPCVNREPVLNGNTVTIDIAPYTLETVMVEF